MMLSVSIQPNTPYLQCASILVAPSGYHEAARGRRKQTSFTTQFYAASHIAQIAKPALPVPRHMKGSFDPGSLELAALTFQEAESEVGCEALSCSLDA